MTVTLLGHRRQAPGERSATGERGETTVFLQAPFSFASSSGADRRPQGYYAGDQREEREQPQVGEGSGHAFLPSTLFVNISGSGADGRLRATAGDRR